MGKKIDMTGWIMKEHGVPDSLLTIISQNKEYRKGKALKRSEAYWNCKCECGNIIVSNGSGLRNGTTKSCGCLQKEKTRQTHRIDLTNKNFGYLTVIEEDFNYKKDKNIKDSSLYWKCRCVCGQEKTVGSQNLMRGTTRSCGCISSRGEAKIKELLTKNKIPFETQKSFKDCRFQNNRPFRFDFYINNSFLLEFDGEQHYKKSGWDTEEKFLLRQKYDSIKTKYCKENNIPLKRIPYWEIDNFTIEDILSDKFLV